MLQAGRSSGRHGPPRRANASASVRSAAGCAHLLVLLHGVHVALAQRQVLALVRLHALALGCSARDRLAVRLHLVQQRLACTRRHQQIRAEQIRSPANSPSKQATPRAWSVGAQPGGPRARTLLCLRRRARHLVLALRRDLCSGARPHGHATSGAAAAAAACGRLQCGRLHAASTLISGARTLQVLGRERGLCIL